MSLPVNRLEKANSYSSYFVIAAFKTTEDAESVELSLDMGPEGRRAGNGVIMLNDYIKKGKAPSRFLVRDLRHDFTWTGTHVNTTSSGGTLVITDTTAGEFLTFLNTEIIKRLDTSLENITFSMRVFWNTPDEGNGEDVIASTHLYFSVSEIIHKLTGNMHFYNCNIVPLFNAKGQYVNYSKIYGMTITHTEGQLHKTQPKADSPGSSIKPRGEEDGEKRDARAERIKKSQPMITLKDAFNAFEAELNASIEIHEAQYQTWQGIIRENFTNKLQKPIQIKKIPIKYKIHLDTVYDEYLIDNRNLPFEQPEQRQNKVGVRVIPTKYGERIEDVIDRIMEYSRKVGEDVRGESAAVKDYKVCLTWRRKGDNVLYDIWIKRYFLPTNPANGFNTGNIAEGAVDPLTFFFKSKEGNINQDDLMTVNGTLNRSDNLLVVEDVVDVEAGRLSYGAEREEISAEREPAEDFFKTGYSGNRAKILNTKTLGVEYPRELAETIKTKYSVQNTQQSALSITVRGNPDLLSDVWRAPKDVVAGATGPATYYARPELLPMYAKVIIRHAPIEDNDAVIQDEFYHQEWMHIYKIENIITNGALFHNILLVRTDEMV